MGHAHFGNSRSLEYLSTKSSNLSNTHRMHEGSEAETIRKEQNVLFSTIRGR